VKKKSEKLLRLYEVVEKMNITRQKP